MTANVNHHCCVVQIDGSGVLLEGPPGSGKTSLALGLLDAAKQRGLEGALVCDDQAILQQCAGTLMAIAPAQIAGLVEIRGHGICRVTHLAEARIDLVARLAPDETIARMPEQKTASLGGVTLGLVEVPRRHESAAIRIILAWLGKPLV